MLFVRDQDVEGDVGPAEFHVDEMDERADRSMGVGIDMLDFEFFRAFFLGFSDDCAWSTKTNADG